MTDKSLPELLGLVECFMCNVYIYNNIGCEIYDIFYIDDIKKYEWRQICPSCLIEEGLY